LPARPKIESTAEGEIYPNSGVTAKGVIRLARDDLDPAKCGPILDGWAFSY
jgi:hypothetical protein